VDGADQRLPIAFTPTRFRVETEVGARVALVSLFGELDVRVADYCKDRLVDVEVSGCHVVIDLRGLTSIDRLGLRTLLRAHMRSRLAGWKLTLVRGPPSVDEAFTPPFIEKLFDWVDDGAAVFPPRPPPSGQRSEVDDELLGATVEMTADPQPLRALERANNLRVARSQLKRRIAEGELTAGEVVLASPWEAATMTLCDLLRCQRQWGERRAHRVLMRLAISETKTIGSLTDRQRHAVAACLSVSQ
jgi:anti-anti-sigma factor